MATIDDKPYSSLLENLVKLRPQVKALVEESQELPRIVSTLGKVYGRHPSLRGEVDGDNQRENVDNQQNVKDPEDRRGKGKKPSHRKGNDIN
uniref:Uncharacterized protein n=1 Tax=Chenopodium quinoa TaxID=63459 RepID=A0A803LZT0_CHEQI